MPRDLQISGVKIWLIRSRLQFWPCNRPLGGREHQGGVFSKHSGRVAWLGHLPVRHAMFDLGVADLNFENTLIDIDADRVSFPDGSDRAAQGGLGTNVADHQAVRGAAKT